MSPSRVIAVTLIFAVNAVGAEKPTPEQILEGARTFFKQSANPAGSFRPAIDREYEGISDSAYSDLAPIAYAVVIHKTFGWPLPHQDKTIEFLLARQREDGSFFNVAGTVDPKSAAGRAYNTTMAVMALRALNTNPKYDPLPVFDIVLKEDYKALPAYMTSFFPLAYLTSGKEIPAEAKNGQIATVSAVHLGGKVMSENVLTKGDQPDIE